MEKKLLSNPILKKQLLYHPMRKRLMRTIKSLLKKKNKKQKANLLLWPNY